MIQRGHIEPYWNIEPIKELQFETHPDVFSGLDLEDKKDQDRYLGIQVDIYHGLPLFLESLLLEDEFAFLTNKIYAISRMSPGSVLPFHRDRYSRYK